MPHVRDEAAASIHPGGDLMSLRVYLVEDSPLVRDRLQESLREDGATVIGHADDATTAIAEIAALRPDVVVLDIALREGTGFHVLDSMAGLPEGERPACVMLTNFTRDWYRNAAKRLGAEYFFDKSSQIPELLGVLRAISAAAGRASAPAAQAGPPGWRAPAAKRAPGVVPGDP